MTTNRPSRRRPAMGGPTPGSGSALPGGGEETPELGPTPPPMASPPPPPAQPEAEQGVSDGTLICTVCRGSVGLGEKYVRTVVRGVNHLEPCSHRA